MIKAIYIEAEMTRLNILIGRKWQIRVFDQPELKHVISARCKRAFNDI